jgi:protein TonB
VIVSFVVLKNGNLSNIKIVRTPHQELSKEAMRLVGSMPKWIPAQMKGKNVNSNYNLVIRFSLP